MSEPFLGFHYDIACGTYLTPDRFCDALRLAARSGYTHFLPCLENMIRLPSMEKACPSCAYTAEDWQRFDAVARDHRIELVPHFNVIGHTERIGPAYPELGGKVDRGHQDVDIERRETREWTLRCLAEFCAFSNSRYFLIGGDEWQPPRNVLARSGFDVAQAWANQVNMAVEFLARKGRKPIVWHDMLVHYPTTLEMLSRKAVIACWFYDQDSDHPVLDTIKKRGFETLMASAVFGGALPTMSHRGVNALRSAAAAAKKHRCDGTLVTTREFARWEFESFHMPMAVRVLRGGKPPAAIVDALALFSAWLKLPADFPVARKWKATIIELLNDASEQEFPDLRRVVLAAVNGDTADDLASYARFHHPQGSGHDRVARGCDPPQWPSPSPRAIPATDASSFGLKIADDANAGDVLRLFNGDESFAVYPRYGASLQDWRRGGDVIVPGAMERFLKRGAVPGGYRSYAAAGGLRPIWALGTHSNPCILWQYPWRWKVTEQTAGAVTIELGADFPHVAVTVRIGIAHGRPGFTYEARGVNKLEHAQGAFHFNLPLSFGLADHESMKLSWSQDGHPRETTIASAAESGFWIPAQSGLTVRQQSWALQIDTDPAQTAGWFVDWGAGFITPDVHGAYRPLQVGEELVTRWRFSLTTP